MGPIHSISKIVHAVALRRVEEDKVSYKRVLDQRRPDMLKGFGRSHI